MKLVKMEIKSLLILLMLCCPTVAQTQPNEGQLKQQTLFALQQALQTINKLDRFDLKDPVAPRLGIQGSPRSESLADAPRVGFSFRSAIDSIVRNQFDELAELAGSFRVKEIRGLGRLEVARLFLEKTDPSAAGRE